jgi:hypothetical protein
MDNGLSFPQQLLLRLGSPSEQLQVFLAAVVRSSVGTKGALQSGQDGLYRAQTLHLVMSNAACIQFQVSFLFRYARYLFPRVHPEHFTLVGFSSHASSVFQPTLHASKIQLQYRETNLSFHQFISLFLFLGRFSGFRGFFSFLNMNIIALEWVRERYRFSILSFFDQLSF